MPGTNKSAAAKKLKKQREGLDLADNFVHDILKNGIYMAGGGSLLYGLDKLITRVTGIRTTVAKNPISCVAMGTGKYLSGISQFRDVAGGLTRDADTKPNNKKQ